jgi:hypothetical protein
MIVIGIQRWMLRYLSLDSPLLEYQNLFISEYISDCDWILCSLIKAMDRAHRLGQTKPVTVYRLVTKGTIEERILLRAKQKHTV